MSPGNRLRAPLAALLIGAVVAGPIVLRPRQPAAVSARVKARADTVVRLLDAGLPRDQAAALEHRSAVEELGQGGQAAVTDPSSGSAGGAPGGIPLGVMLLLVLAALASAVTTASLVDGDLDLLGRRVAAVDPRAPSAASGAERLPLGDLAFAETVRLGEALRVALPEAGADGDRDAAQRRDTRRQRSQFLASMSHDLRSPLNSILGFTELLMRGADGPIDDEARRPLNAIRATGKRLLRLINQILDTARCEAGRMSLERRPTLVAGLLREAVEELRRFHDLPPDIEVEPQLQPGLQPVEVDRARIAQALALLLGEAVGAASAGVVRLGASERRQGEARFVVFEIDSPGALRAGLSTGFSAAFRVVAPGDLGLALPLARSLIELHGGTVVVEEGPPARFVVSLPAAVKRERLGVLRIRRA